MTPKQETKKFNKSTTRSDDNYGKTRLRLWIQKGKYSNI